MVSVNVGPYLDDSGPDVEAIGLGISGHPESLLRLLIESLNSSREFWINSLTREANDIAVFLATLK
jgi:hypothetical protein